MIIAYTRCRWILAASLMLLVAVSAATADYATEVLDLNPLGYWRLGDSTGPTAVDLSGNGLHGAYNGSVTLGQTGALVDDPDTAALFSGGYVSIGHDDSLLLNSGTILMWINDTGGLTGEGLFSKDASYFVTGGHLTVRTDDTGRLTVRLQSTTDSYEVTTPEAILADRWYMLAFSFGSAGMKLYVDDSLADTDSYTGGLAGNYEPLAFGANTWASDPGELDPVEYFSGFLDEVAVFGSQLSGAQIAQLHETGSVPEPTTLALLVTGGWALARRRRR